MRPTRRQSLLLLVVAVLAAGALMWVRRQLGTETSGRAETAVQLPALGQELADLAPGGPLYYRHLTGPRGSDLFVSGIAREDDVKRFCEAHQLAYQSSYPRAGSGLTEKLKRYRGGESRIVAEFTDEDGFAMGTDSRLGRVELHYRHADGAFTAVMSPPRE